MARVLMKIPVGNIKAPKNLPLNMKTLKFAVVMLYKDDKFPPIAVVRENGAYILKGDGRHRLAAAKLSGKKEILAHVAIPEEPYPYKPSVHKR